MRQMTHVLTILELRQILRKMMGADMDMSAVDRAFQLSPKAFKPVHARAGFVAEILPAIVVHADMAKAGMADILVSAEFVSAKRRARQNAFEDHTAHRRLMASGHNAGDDIAAPLQSADDDRLVAHVTIALAADRAADDRFVHLDSPARPAERPVAVNRAHILADHVAHAPCGFVGDAELALDLFRGNAVPRSAELKHDEKPIAKRGARAIERGASGRIDLPAAPFARVGAALGDAIEARVTPAPIAIVALAVAGAHKVIEAAFFRGEAGLKLAERGGFRLHA